MPNNKGHLTLVSDTSAVACGAALYQEQRGNTDADWPCSSEA